MKISNLSQARNTLLKIASKKRSPQIDKFSRIREVLKALDNPHENLNIIHVAGTSGKTSTAYYCAEILRRSGKKVGLTVSPHVNDINDRVQIDGSPLSEKIFCEYLEKYLDKINSISEPPTYFELMVGFALYVFSELKVEYAVVEVGIGGTFDTTNILDQDNKICIINNIGIDHTDILGETIEEIAENKFGIIHKNNVAFTINQNDKILNIGKSHCKKNNAILKIIMPKLPLWLGENNQIAEYQKTNWLLAYSAISYLSARDDFNLPKLSSLKASANLQIPARMEIYNINDKKIIIDVAHNGQKTEALVNSYKKMHPSNDPPIIIVGFLDAPLTRIEGSIQQLKKLSDKIIITEFKQEKNTPKISAQINKVNDIAIHYGMNTSIYNSAEEALNFALKQDNKQVLITGSFYLMNDIRPLLQNMNPQ